VVGFYAARSGTIPPLPWTNFAPPLSPRRAVDDRIPADADNFGAMPSHGIDLVQNMSKPSPFVKTGVTAMVNWVGDAFK
jgi:hypothetical protein